MPEDADAMSALINPIIAEGSTTAHRNGFDAARMLHHYIAPPHHISCVTAWEGDTLLGFQSLVWSDPDYNGHGKLPGDWAVIGSFVQPHGQGKGVGRAMFAVTREIARQVGVVAIDATIRADNVPGLRYYSKMGFQDFDRLNAVPLSDGTLVDRIRKRYDLA